MSTDAGTTDDLRNPASLNTATLVARPQTQRTYALACARLCAGWPLAGPEI